MKIKVSFLDSPTQELSIDGTCTLESIKDGMRQQIKIDPSPFRFFYKKHLITLTTIITQPDQSNFVQIFAYNTAAYPLKSFPRSDFAFPIDYPKFAPENERPFIPEPPIIPPSRSHYMMQHGHEEAATSEPPAESGRPDSSQPIRGSSEDDEFDAILDEFAEVCHTNHSELTPEDKVAINRFVQLGYDKEFVQQIFLACNSDEHLTMTFLASIE